MWALEDLDAWTVGLDLPLKLPGVARTKVHDHLEVGNVVEEVGDDVPIPHPLRVLLALLGSGDGIPRDRDAPVEVEVLEALPEHIDGGVVIGEAECPAPLDPGVLGLLAYDEHQGVLHTVPPPRWSV